MKKLVCFVMIVLWFMGAIGGVGFAIYGDSWPCAAGCLINGLLAFPTVKKAFQDLKY